MEKATFLNKTMLFCVNAVSQSVFRLLCLQLLIITEHNLNSFISNLDEQIQIFFMLHIFLKHSRIFLGRYVGSDSRSSQLVIPLYEGGKEGYQSCITLDFSIKSRITEIFFNQSRIT